jgi:hypothetical protein
MLTVKIAANTIPQFCSRQLAVGLKDGPLAVHPARFNRVEPGGFDRQAADQQAYPATLYNVAVMNPDPLPDLSADVPEALSQINSKAFLPSAASCFKAQPRNAVVTGLTGRPSTKRSNTRSVSLRSRP